MDELPKTIEEAILAARAEQRERARALAAIWREHAEKTLGQAEAMLQDWQREVLFAQARTLRLCANQMEGIL